MQESRNPSPECSYFPRTVSQCNVGDEAKQDCTRETCLHTHINCPYTLFLSCSSWLATGKNTPETCYLIYRSLEREPLSNTGKHTLIPSLYLKTGERRCIGQANFAQARPRQVVKPDRRSESSAATPDSSVLAISYQNSGDYRNQEETQNSFCP